MRTTLAVLSILLLQATIGSAVQGATQHSQADRTRNSDAYLQREVGHQLNMVPWYTVFDILKYNVSNDVVTLTGAVTNPTVKTDAENAVKGIEGVENVVDQVEVLPPSPLDDQIRLAEYRAIYKDQLSRYGLGTLQSIHIIVKGGHVTLEGNVDNQTDKNVASVYAKGVPNVFSVTNNLVVTGGK